MPRKRRMYLPGIPAHVIQRDDACFYAEQDYREYLNWLLVRAGMVEHPGEYPWSSYRCNAYGEINRYVTDYELYKVLGENNKQRWEHYRSLFEIALNPGEVQKIREAATFSTPLGNDRFRGQIEAALNRSVGFTRRGRSVTVKEERV